MKTIKNHLKPRFSAIFVAAACLFGGLAACQKSPENLHGEQQLTLTPANLAGNWDVPTAQGMPTKTQLRFSTTEMTTYVTDGAVSQQSAVTYQLGSDRIVFPGSAGHAPYLIRSLTKSSLVVAMDEAGAYYVTLARNENSGQSVLKPLQQDLALTFKVGTEDAKTFDLAQRVNTDDTGKDTITCRLKGGLLTIEANRTDAGKTFGFKFASQKIGQTVKLTGQFKDQLSKGGGVELGGTTDQGRAFNAEKASLERCQASITRQDHMLGLAIACTDIEGATTTPALDVTIAGQCVLRLL